jgi:hypothetical protein
MRQWCIRSRPDRPAPSARLAGTDEATRLALDRGHLNGYPCIQEQPGVTMPGQRPRSRSRSRFRLRPRLRLRPTLNPGLLGRIGRPSVARAAWSRGRLPDRLRPRCSRERRPPSEPEEIHRNALPVECPVALLCGMCCGTGWLFRHNCVPGTSRWGAFSACPAAAPVPDAAPDPASSSATVCQAAFL